MYKKIKYNIYMFYFLSSFIQYALYLSQATYCETSQNWTCKTCDHNLQLLETIENYGEKALINKKDNTLFVSFRGSTNIQNWLDNVQFTLKLDFTRYMMQ